MINSLRRKLGDDGKDPTYIFTELRVGYRMPKGERRGDERPRSRIGSFHNPSPSTVHPLSPATLLTLLIKAAGRVLHQDHEFFTRIASWGKLMPQLAIFAHSPTLSKEGSIRQGEMSESGFPGFNDFQDSLS